MSYSYSFFRQARYVQNLHRCADLQRIPSWVFLRYVTETDTCTHEDVKFSALSRFDCVRIRAYVF